MYKHIFSLLMKTKGHKNSCHDRGLFSRKLDPKPSQKVIKMTLPVMYRDHAIVCTIQTKQVLVSARSSDKQTNKQTHC